MVVAQIPLWIIHGTTPTGVLPQMGAGGTGTNTSGIHTSRNNLGGQPQPNDEHNNNDNDGDFDGGDGDDGMNSILYKQGKSQFHLWNTTSTNGDGGDNSNNNDNNLSTTPKTAGGERRSAIYACDVDQKGGRIATGGGDGKIRIWNLISLFQTTKGVHNVDGNNNADNGNANENTNVDVDVDVDVDEQNNENRKMGSFHQGGGYDSSDSSDCATTNGDDDNHQHQHSSSTAIESSFTEQVNDISSLIKRKKDVVNSTSTTSSGGKKRKRAELIQVHASAPQATIATSSSKSSQQQQQQQQQQTKAFPPKQRLLCTLASHSGSVLTLRFSTSGTFLASAGDDAHVLLYTRTNTPSILSTGNLLSSSSSSKQEHENVEYWERIRILRGHNLDVVGLAWAPDDSHLVSCSLDSDNPICVWRLNLDGYHGGGGDSGGSAGTVFDNRPSFGASGGQRQYRNTSGNTTTLHPYRVLGRTEHTSTVKGVAFDPAGKYVATSGDDPAICIWRAFDDWGLEARIDSSSGIFRSKKKNNSTNGDGSASGVGADIEEDMQALANLSLFRRISFAPDGTHVCGTNATLREKNIAAMISRNGWGVSGPNKKVNGSSSTKKGVHNTAGAANLVGHKQPVVSSRHCPFFFEVDQKHSEQGDDSNDDDIEPNYSTLVALGDKKGFITIWSTKKSRPIFKLQCSESRCTVTDIAWGLVQSSPNQQSIVMLVSLLDGFLVALKFDLPNELGCILSQEKTSKIFRLKYGIELGNDSVRKRLVDDKSGPKLIENVLQFAMEDDNDDDDDKIANEEAPGIDSEIEDERLCTQPTERHLDSSTQHSNLKNGKKHIQPTLINQSRKENSEKSVSIYANGKQNRTKSKHQSNQQGKGVSEALDMAQKAASVAEGIYHKNAKKTYHTGREGDKLRNGESLDKETRTSVDSQIKTNTTFGFDRQSQQNVVSPKCNRLFNVLLQSSMGPSHTITHTEDNNLSATSTTIVKAICTNSTKDPPGFGRGIPCVTVAINRGGQKTWNDHILGTHCTSLAACNSLIAVGTLDGTVYLYGTSPTSGWNSGIGFRSHTPFVMPSSVVYLSLHEKKSNNAESMPRIEILVLTSNGSFGVYSIAPSLKLKYKGTIVDPMNQMCLSCFNQALHNNNNDVNSPELSRIFITESNHLLLVLNHSKNSNAYVGGTVQGFIYNRDMELWTRITDERFLYSNFYTTVPSSKLSIGLLAHLDQAVKGSKRSNPSQGRGAMDPSAASMYYLHEDDEHSLQSYITRAHCEDRLACALALQSSSDFKHWLFLYIRQLCVEADSNQLRFLIDMLLNDQNVIDSDEMEVTENNCWWLLSGSSVMGLNKRELVEHIIIPEMSKNRSLQRLMNEISTELMTIL